MRRSRFSSYLVVCLLALPFATSLLARGQAWAFMGYTQVDRRQNHSNVQVTRRDCFFRTIRLRVSEAIFFDRLVVHFGNGTSQELIIGERILPEGGSYVIDLPGEPRLLENVDLWYYKEPWGRDPKVSLYGIPAGSIDDGGTAPKIRSGRD
jgi:hypothetical protein